MPNRYVDYLLRGGGYYGYLTRLVDRLSVGGRQTISSEKRGHAFERPDGGRNTNSLKLSRIENQPIDGGYEVSSAPVSCYRVNFVKDNGPNSVEHFSGTR